MNEFTSIVFYLVMFALSAFLLYVGNIGPKRSGPLICIALLIPIMIAALRYGVGTDFWAYFRGFYSMQNTPWQSIFRSISGFEYGGAILTKTISVFGDHSLYFGTFSALTILPVYFALKKHYSNASISFCFFFYLFLYFTSSFNILRQMAAVSVIFWGMNYVFERKALKYFLTVLFAMCFFHTSAFIALPVYFLWDKDRKCVAKIPAIAFICVTLVFAFAFESFFEQLSLLGDNFERYGEYANEEREHVGKNRDLIVKALICVTMMAHGKHLLRIDPRNQLFILFLIITVLFGITGFNSPFIKRSAVYYEVFSVILLAQVSNLYAHGNKPLINFCLFLYAAGLFVLVFYVLRQSNIIPYRIGY